MNILQLIIRWFLRLKWWFIFLPAGIALIAVLMTQNLNQRYNSDITIYTGVISNYDPGQSAGKQDWNMLNNSIQNIINTIQSKETLRKLAIRLYARLMIHGSLDENNTYIESKHYKELLDITPIEVRKLIDKKSEDITVENLLNYEKPTRDNFVYGLMNWNHPYFSYSSLKDNLKIKRLDNTDILVVNYETNDPGITYQTLVVLSEIFSDEYRDLQFSNTHNVIKYFENELDRIGKELRLQEDSLTLYNLDNRVINYDKQTEAIALLDKEFSLRAQEVFFTYYNTQAALTELEGRLDGNLKSLKNNTDFLNRLNRISDVNYDISKAKTKGVDSVGINKEKYLSNLNKDLKNFEEDLKGFTDQYIAEKYTAQGYPNSSFVIQWIDELVKLKRAEADVKVIRDFEAELDQKYIKYSPIGSVLKRKERSINFTEQSYLSILSSLNQARLRLKSLEMNSAVLKVINPPNFPLNSLPSHRKVIVLGSYFGTILLLFGFFLLVELLDRTLRDKLRTERLTKLRVIGAFPNANVIKNRDLVEQKIIHVVANNLYSLMHINQSWNLINIIPLVPIRSENNIVKLLSNYWANQGIKVKSMYEGTDFISGSREYLIGQEWKTQLLGNDIAIVQHAPLSETLIPTSYLNESIATLVLLDTDTLFNTEDEILLNSLVERLAEKQVFVCLVGAKKDVIEEFTGLLPPYTFLRKMGYRLSNFGLTSRN
ncbi:GumC domain-containing protein [Sphingobacterium rhinopitheci]|uniref:hypothetical protein n=1 Tax=Sphingobacterium rhinopitheci TaxID=2781960 RepID=UPI001F51F8EA|nr:hypothetical protein [Sphingobacterium rhinopitheci]MCI0920539.1 hypothetical protein [Sphingobacterium rhinopitheci]